MHHLFQFRENPFSLRNFRELAAHNKRTSNYRLETMSYKAPFLRAKLPSEYKNSTPLSEFKTKIIKIGKVMEFVVEDYVRFACQIP